MYKSTHLERFITLYETLLSQGKVKSKRDFAIKLGVTPQYLSPIFARKDTATLSIKTMNKAIALYELSEDYFYKVKEEEHKVINEIEPQYIKQLQPVPYYDIDITAGAVPMLENTSIVPDDYIFISKQSGVVAYLSVKGNSMIPVIRNGDIIGVRPIKDNIIDTSKIYLIITPDNRMIKYLKPDAVNKNTIWCISPNYPEFSILRSDILHLYQVSSVISYM